MNLRLLARIHLWIGVATALPLGAIALSGSLLVFRDSLWLPSDWRMEPRQTAATDAALAAALAADADWLYVDLANHGRGFHVLSDADHAERVLKVGAAATEPAPARIAIAQFLYRLHAQLLVGDAGKTAVRVLGPLALASLVIGFLVWWPRRSAWRAADLAGLAMRRPPLLRFHMAWGAVALIVLLPLVTSGTLLAQNPTIRAWLRTQAPPARPLAREIEALRFTAGDLAAALAAARLVWPDGYLTQIGRTTVDAERLTLKFRLPGERHQNGRSFLALNLRDGRVVSAIDARSGGLPAAYDDFLYPFHTARFGGAVQGWLWICAALSLLALLTTGVLAWIRKPR